MKYQQLVSSTTPSSLQEWLEEELESRGIDGVYTRYILSLLQEDSLDIEPFECHHAKNSQQKVLHKYGGPESLFSVTKSKHQKWKTWDKQILLTTSATCCAILYSDLEKMKRNAAIECLRSASDDINDIENLIDEVCIKLNNIKKLTGEKEDNSICNITLKREGAFYISPSSPTEEIEKYFAAFPSLSGKIEQKMELSQNKNFKNVWCENCLMKKNMQDSNHKRIILASVENIGVLKREKSFQPAIPYDSLKSIKNMCKINNATVIISDKGSDILSKVDTNSVVSKNVDVEECDSDLLEVACHMKTNTEVTKFGTHAFEYSKLKQPLLIQCLALPPFMNLNSLVIYEIIFTKNFLLDLYHDGVAYCQIVEVLANTRIHCVELNNNMPITSDLSYSVSEKAPFEANIFTYDAENLLYPKINSFYSSDLKASLSSGFSDNLEISSSRMLNIIDDSFVSFGDSPFNKQTIPLSEHSISRTLRSDFPRVDNHDLKELLRPLANSSKSEILSPSIASPYKDLKSMLINNVTNDCDKYMCYPLFSENVKVKSVKKLQSKCMVSIPGLDEKYISGNQFDQDFTVSHMEKISFIHHEGQSKFLEVPAYKKLEQTSNRTSDEKEQILHSDDESCQFFCSDDDENLLISSKTHFQPIQLGSTITDNISSKLNVSHPVGFLNDNFLIRSTNNVSHKNVPKTAATKNHDQQMLKKIANIDKLIQVIDMKSDNHSLYFNELSSAFLPNEEKMRFNNCEQNYIKPIYFKNFRDKRTNAGNSDNPVSCFQEESRLLKNFGSQDTVAGLLHPTWDIECHQGISHKKGLSCWVDNYSSLEHIWKNYEDCKGTVKREENILNANSDGISALRKEIKEEEDELLRGLTCITSMAEDISEIGNEVEAASTKQINPHSKTKSLCTKNPKVFDVTSIPMNEILLPSNDASSVINCKKMFDSSKMTVPVDDHDVFTFDSCENNVPDSHNVCSEPDYVHINVESCQATNFLDLSAFRGSYEESHPKKDSYMEGGGWSLAPDCVFDMDSETFYDRACSLGDLDVEESESNSSEFLQCGRVRFCSEESEDYLRMKYACKFLRKRMKQRYPPPWRRPCTFYMEGSCRRSDCRFSHDLSTITCRFWQEGSCFKGITCPFLHGYTDDRDFSIGNNNSMRSHTPDNSYSLESEADFPSLSSANNETLARSDPVDIEQGKSSKRKRKKEKSQSGSSSLQRDDQETSSSWPGYKSM